MALKNANLKTIECIYFENSKDRRRYENIDISKIIIDKSYQREVSQTKVKKIVKNFDMNAFKTLLLNKRDGDDDVYYLVDGQHRLSAAEIKKLKYVPCCIIEGLTKEEEAELFVTVNRQIYPPTSIHTFKAKIAANDKIALKILEIMSNNGFKPYLINGGNEYTRRRGYITTFNLLETIYKSKGENMLDKVLGIIKDAWRYQDGTFDPDALSKYTIEGIYTFLVKCPKTLDIKKLITKLRKESAIKFIHEQNKNYLIYGKGKPYNYAKAILEVYNYRAINKIEFINI